MATVTGTRSRTTQKLAATVATLTDEIRSMQENTDELCERRREALSVLVSRVGKAEAGRMVGLSKVRVGQIVGGT